MTDKLFSGICAGVAAVVWTFLLNVACTQEQPEIAVESVAIEEEGLTLFIGDSQQLHAVFTPDNASTRSISWSIDREDVATVNEHGLVTAVAKGEAEVTAAVSGKTATCKVSVYDNIVSVTGVTLPDKNLTVNRDEVRTLVATVEPADATNKTVSWTSSDPAVAFISQEGELRALQLGKAVITVTTEDGEFTATCDVTVDASEYTVTFETDGGTAIAPVTVKKGDMLQRPADPQKGGLDEGLYEGTISDPESGTVAFAGWYTDPELQNEYDFSTVLASDMTLYAKWDGEVQSPIELSDDTDIVNAALAYCNGHQSGEYTLVLASDVANPAWSGRLFEGKEVSLTVIGKGEERTVSRTVSGIMFEIWGGTLTIGSNIRLTGNTGGSSLIELNGSGTFVMLDGSKISGVEATGEASVLRSQSGQATFTMKGGEISGNLLEADQNTLSRAATMSFHWNSYVNIEGGVICDNRVVSTVDNQALAGAILIRHNYANFNKTGGELKGNTAECTAISKGVIAQEVLLYNDGAGQPPMKVDADLGPDDDLSNKNTGAGTPWVAVE